MFTWRLTHPPMVIINGSLIDLPAPSNLKYWWNFGSLLGLCLSVQLMTGLFLAFHYSADLNTSFSSVSHLIQDVPSGWLLRTIHANGASMFFLCLYLHISRGIYYSGFLLRSTWCVGIGLLLMVMATAFMGYVLPWGQMSFWGTTVITNLLSALPYIGQDVVMWLWGGFAVGNPTLTRFFGLHFVLPFMIISLTGVHLLFLHQSGSSNPVMVKSSLVKISFSPYYGTKDLAGGYILVFFIGILILQAPWALGDPENFIPANPMITPIHIQPEWYFLFAYAVLRAIPNKLGGVVALISSVVILFIFLYSNNSLNYSSTSNRLLQMGFWSLVATFMLLTWVGARPVEEPYSLIGQLVGTFYFICFLFLLLFPPAAAKHLNM